MERSEPSLVPEWLKGASGSSFPTSQPTSHQDDAANSFIRHKGVQKIADVQAESGPARGSASSDRIYSPSVWRSHNNNTGNIHYRGATETEILVPGRPHHSLSLSKRDDAVPSNGHRGDYQESEQENERDLWPRTNGSISAFGIDEKEKKSKQQPWNRKLQLSIPGKSDEDPKLRRSQSMGLSSKTSDNISLKNGDVVSITSPLLLVSGGLTSSKQKSVFERNFPSLNIDDKLGGLHMSPGNIASPRTAWQSSSRLDAGRAASPGLSGGLGVTSNGGFGGVGTRSVALAETVSLNGSSLNNRLGHDSSSGSSNSVNSMVSTMSNGTAVLNMAEALNQNPHRARTPPLPSTETQRLESLALKQSRQLIPVIPTLPKAMSLTDKSKTKGSRNVDGTVTATKSNQSSGLLQPVQRIGPTKTDILKHSQGKLLVLKSNKDGSLMATAVPKFEVNNGIPSMPSRVATSSTNSFTQPKKPHDGQATSYTGLSNLHIKDFLDQDKRSSTHAQNRSDFFNALRKKSTVKSESAVQPNFNVVPENQSCETAENSIDGHLIVRVSSHMDSCGEGSLGSESSIENTENEVTVDSEEEEAAFMRSLGWEENAECSELTEEEINAFYQMREKKLHNSESHFSVSKEHPVGSLESLSSSDSDLDDRRSDWKCK